MNQFYHDHRIAQSGAKRQVKIFLSSFLVGALLFGFKATAQLYSQTFSTTLASTSGSTTGAPYCASSPNASQLNIIASNGAGCSYEVPSATNRLTFSRTGNVGMFTRSTDFNPIPTAAFYKFDLTVSGNSSAQDNAALFQMGFGFSTSTFGSESQAHGSFGINFTSTPGQFTLRNAANTASSIAFSGTQTITWVINNNGSTVSYVAPDGSIQTVGDDKDDIWVGNTLAFDETNAFDPARSLRNIKFVFHAGVGTIELDNIVVAPVTALPVTSDQVICGATPQVVSSLTATGTNLKWYSTASGGTALGAGDPVSPGTYYVSQTLNGFESARASKVVTFSNVAVSGNTISGDQTICTGTIPDSLTGPEPTITNGSGLFTYQWQLSSTSAVAGFSNISGAINKNYSPPSLTATRWYRRVVTSDGCIDISNALAITVNGLITNTITAAQSVCEGVSPAALGGNPSGGGGTGTYTYAWEMSTTDGTSGFSVIPAANSISFSPGPLSDTTWFRRIVTSGPCPAVTSVAIRIAVLPSVTDNTITSDQTICTGSIPASIIGSTPSGGNGSYAYYWETSTTSPGVSGYSAAGGTTKDFTPVTALTVNRWYRRRVISGVCTTFSAPVQITVNPAIANNTISASQTICAGATPNALTGSTPTGGNSSYTYSWESSTTSASSGFSAIPSANSQGFAPTSLTQTTWFRRVVSAGVCPASNSAAIAITVNQPITNNIISSDQMICANTAPAPFTGTVATGGNGTSYAYLWEFATSATGTFSSTSITSINYSPPSIPASRWYRRRVTSGVCPVHYSDTIVVTTQTAIGNNTIGANQFVCDGSAPAPFTGSLPTGGDGNYTYSWEFSTTSNSTGFSALSGSNSQGYSFSSALSQNTWFRRVVTSGLCSSTSGAITMTVTLPIGNNVITSSPETICSGTAPSLITATTPTGGTGTSFAYQWEVSSNGGTSYSNATGGGGANYQSGNLSISGSVPLTRLFRRRVTSGGCPISYSDPVVITVVPAIGSNTISTAQNVCEGFSPVDITGTNPTGGSGVYAYTWETSTTSGSAGFSTFSGANMASGFNPGTLTQNTWIRRVITSGVCSNTSASIQMTVSVPPTVDAGPAMPSTTQGGITGALGGSFGGSATGAIWSATEGTFNLNTGSTPGTATFVASLISSPTVTLTLTTIGSVCPAVSASKTISVVPDPFGVTGVVNSYGEVVGPTTLPVGSLKCTLAAGEAAQFSAGDRALLIQMKGASANLPGSPTDVTYGYLTAMNNSGNHEFVTISAVNGDEVTFERCIKKAYTISGRVQLVRVPVYNGNYNIKSSTIVSTVRLTRRGMGYLPNTEITSGFTITPVNGGSGLQLKARTDANGQISEVIVVDGGSGYLSPPLITLPDPTEAPYNFTAYRAKALAVMGLTGKQWNGKTGGILVVEMNGGMFLNDSIHMTGMGFAGGMIGDKGDLAPTCGASAEYALNFSAYTRAGQKGESIVNIPVTAMRGKGRYGTGGGGGVEPDGGGGGGANWQDGGRGGSSSYIVITNSACSTSVTPCDKDASRGGLGAGTNPTTPPGFRNVLRANSYYYQPEFARIFLGGGGGGGHAFNDVYGMEDGGSGGFGGGIVIIKADALTSNGYEILAKGEKGENATGDGAGGGGAGGAVLLMVDQLNDAVRARVNGGNGGNSIADVCESSPVDAFPDRKRYSGAGGGGGGGVVWFAQPDVDVNLLAVDCNLAQSNAGINEDGFGNTAQKGGSARSQSELVFVENIPYTGSVFTVGGTSPKPTFPDLAKAADWLALKGTDADSVTLLVANNNSNAAYYNWYTPAATFKRLNTPACTPSDATVIVKPVGAVNSVRLQNQIDDLDYIIVDGLPKLTLKDLTIRGEYDYVGTGVLVKNNSRLVLDNVNAIADIRSDNTGTNPIDLKNSVHTGNVQTGTNQVLTLIGTVQMNGITSSVPGLRLGTGSTLNMGAGTVLNLNGGSWINNGVGTLNLDPTSEINITGNFTTQVIGGTTPSTFTKLNILGSGQLTLNQGPTVYEWNQTGSTLVNTSNKTLTITGKVKSGPGRFASSGAGRVSLNGSSPVEVEGRFGNLEVNSVAGAIAKADIQVDQTLILSDGKLDMASFVLKNENASGVSETHTPNSWVLGQYRQKIQAGKSYFLPVGSATHQEKSFLNFNSVTGLQYITARFISSDPNAHPVASIVNPQQDTLTWFTSVDPGGYWSINPDAGTADYDIAIFPSFAISYPTYTVYKRPTGGNTWDMFGLRDNPAMTSNYIQPDGSIRRRGLSGFSDFAVAGGEVPLPLNFLDFRASLRRGKVRLNWRMGDCLNEGRFTIFRSTSNSGFLKVGEVNFQNAECQSEFEAEDNLQLGARKYFYKIQAESRNEKPEFSPVRVVEMTEDQAEKPFLSLVQGTNNQYQIMNENIELSGIRLISVDGKVVADNLKAANKILDFQSIPKGVYLVEMVNSGWSVRQRIAVGF